MQEALKNQHYKKIWEKVIMNRHPEAKSLEGALEMELLQEGSLYIHYNEVFSVLHRRDFEKFAGIQSYGSRGSCVRHLIHQIEPQILGRPITLEDILLLHNKEDCDNNYLQTDGFCVYDEGNYHLFEWKPTKPLHEQTPETWEGISNLI